MRLLLVQSLSLFLSHSAPRRKLYRSARDPR
nr:MAG TPA: hypothetical protein [Caudoviricetes sp.]